MGNSISLNLFADDAHLTVNSQRHPRTPASQLNSPFSVRSDVSSQVTAGLSASDSSLRYEEEDDDKMIQSPHVKMRQCWICYGEEEIVERAEFAARWVSPCKCKGTTKWVHQACLLDWIDSQVTNNATLAASRVSPVINSDNIASTATSPFTTPLLNANSPALTNPAPRFQPGDGPLILESVSLACPQCHALYKISEAHALPRHVLLGIDYLAKIKERVLVWSTFGLVSGSIYTVAFSYGLFNGWMVGGQEFMEHLRDAFNPIHGNSINRLQLAAAIPLTPLFALSSAFSAFSWTYPLVPLFLFDGYHRISLTQPRGILLFMPLVWSSHRIVVDSLIPSIYRRLARQPRRGPELNIYSASDESIALAEQSTSSALSLEDQDSSSMTSSEYSAAASGSSTVKISILSTTAAFLFPSVAALTGWAIAALLPKTFAKVSPFYRSLIGASVLTAFKDFSKLLYWYQTVRLRKYRRVLNRPE